LNAEASVDLGLALIVLPDDAELDDSLWDGGDSESGFVFWVLLEERGVLEGGDKLWRMVN
jgi:hypothetical protein